MPKLAPRVCRVPVPSSEVKAEHGRPATRDSSPSVVKEPQHSRIEAGGSSASAVVLRAGTRGWNFERVFGKNAAGAISVEVLQPHMHDSNQQRLFVEFLRFLATIGSMQIVRLISRAEDQAKVDPFV